MGIYHLNDNAGLGLKNVPTKTEIWPQEGVIFLRGTLSIMFTKYVKKGNKHLMQLIVLRKHHKSSYGQLVRSHWLQFASLVRIYKL